MKNGRIALYNNFERASFIARENRFTLVLNLGKTQSTDITRAYIPNTGRMEEFCVHGHPFFVTTSHSKKFKYRVVSTEYQGSFVLLDTVAVQRTIQKLLEKPAAIGLSMNTGYRLTQEKTIGKSRFDFYLEKTGLPPVLVEIKSCTLCHNGTALFPDAPSTRASSHIRHLRELVKDGMKAYMVFIITNGSARIFYPNFHTDPMFSSLAFKEAGAERGVCFRALTVPLADPVTVDTAHIRQVPIDWKSVLSNNPDFGSYILVLRNERLQTIRVGALGSTRFERGYYVYIGSALGSLSNRVHRHRLKRKKLHWHIDYITPSHMQLKKTYLIRRGDRIETELVGRLKQYCSDYVRGFGASDSSQPSHLLYFKEVPFKQRFFMDTVLDFRTFTEHALKNYRNSLTYQEV